MNTGSYDFGAFVAMGGYGGYVWGAFGLTAAVVVAELLGLRARSRALRRFVEDEAAQRTALGEPAP